MDKKIKGKAFAKLLAGIANRAEEELVINSSEVESLMQEQWQNPSDLEGKVDGPNKFRILAAIYKHIGIKEARVQKQARIRLIRTFTAVAAILTLVMVTGITTILVAPLLPTSRISFSNPSGVNSEIFLPDGSRIWLNPNSSVRYSKAFDKSTRSVELEGEAYFNVSHNPNRPFVVKTKTMDVAVMGTRFGVVAKNKTKQYEVSLVKGKVSVIGKFEGLSRQVDLSPGQKAIWFSNTGEYKLQGIDEGIAKPWGTTLLRFENETFANIAKKIESTFGISVILPSKLGDKYRFTASFSDESVFEIFNLLKLTAPFDFAIQGNKVVISEKK